jgi:integrase
MGPESRQATLKFKKKPEKARLNKRTIEGLTPPASVGGKPQQAWTYDSETPRLAICTWSSGARTWYWVGRCNGRMMRLKLGEFPEITPEHARKLASKTSADVANGIDARVERRRTREELTLGELFEQYLERHAKTHKRTWQDDEKQFRRYCDGLKGRPMSSITRSDVMSLHSRIGKDHGRYAANRLLALLSMVFAFAVDVGFEGPNPCRGVKRFKEESRERFLDGDELRRFFDSLAHESELMQDYFMLALLTGGRRGNVQAIRWDELDLDRNEWKIPGEKFKNGKPQTVHLPSEAVTILRRRAGNGSEYVFPSRKGSAKPHLMFQYRAWNQICRRAGLKGVRPHDLRRTLGSWQAATGASLPVIGKSLGHRSQATTAIYARLDLDPVRASVDTAVAAMMAAANGQKKEIDNDD